MLKVKKDRIKDLLKHGFVEQWGYNDCGKIVNPEVLFYRLEDTAYSEQDGIIVSTQTIEDGYGIDFMQYILYRQDDRNSYIEDNRFEFHNMIFDLIQDGILEKS